MYIETDRGSTFQVANSSIHIGMDVYKRVKNLERT
jgi:hypothetical protein